MGRQAKIVIAVRIALMIVLIGLVAGVLIAGLRY